MNPFLKHPVGIALSSAIFVLVGCSHLTGEGESVSSDTLTELAGRSEPVLKIDAAAGDLASPVCIVTRIAQDAGVEVLQDALEKHLTAQQNSTAESLLQGAQPKPELLNDVEKAAAYRCISSTITGALAASDHAMARLVPEWRKVTDTPFYDPEFGGRYIMVHASDGIDTDTEIGAFTDRGIAAGGTLATPGFTVDNTGIISPGPTVLMEKMARGFTTAFGNYRYTVLDPSAQVVATTNGANKEYIALCERCTDRGADQLFLALLNGSAGGDESETLPEAPRAVYEDAPSDAYGTPPSDAFRSPEPGSLDDPLDGEVLDPDAVLEGDEIDSLDLEVELDPSVDLLAE